MPFEQFAATLGAVIAGNVLSVLFVWFLWAGTKWEASGRDLKDAPWRLLLAGIIGPVVGASCVYFAVT